MARHALLAILVWLAVLIIPAFSLSDYHLFQLTMVAVYAIAILGLAILTGFNGQISLGHGAFYAIGAGLFLLAWNILRGRIGRAMMAIRDHALAAEAMGIDIALLKTRTFALSAMYTGVAGSLGAIVVQFVAPDSFSIFVSIYFFVGLLVGGVSSIAGAILVGAVI